ncbi:MAG: dienelactone hydrolase family protein [Dehalococcoidia bacterium]|nr:dienelactone hydrolase family protein [Dehalococcoidia bacterium]
MASFWEIQRVESGGTLLDDMATYVAQPNEPGRHPAVIVIQEVFGVNHHIQNVADRFAAAGYFAVAPALFHREGANEEVRGTNPEFGYPGAPDGDARNAAVGRWKDQELVLDLQTTIDWLRNHPRVVNDKIGIVGFCAGGRITYLAAAACRGLSAAVNFYGGNTMAIWGAGPTPFERTAQVSCPMLGLFGDQDANPTPDDVSKIEAAMKAAGKTFESHMYQGAGHGFFCDERDSYHEASAKDAWEKTLGWFAKYLAPVKAAA